MTIAQFIPSQLPAFIQEQYPEFCLFLKHYYEFLEEENNPLYKTDRIFSEISLDSVSNSNLNHFVEYIGKYLPTEYGGDTSHLLKYIKEFYLSRGTEESYKFFMSMLFGFEAGQKTKIDYPIKNVLHASLGNWIQKKSLKLSYIDVDLSSLLNKKIIDFYGIEAIIENAFSYSIGTTKIIEIFLQPSSISGTFNLGAAKIVSLDVNILPVISGVKINNYGSGYSSDDVVVITSVGPSGTGAVFKISDIVGGEIYKIDLIQSGLNYNTITPDDITIDSDDGVDFEAELIVGALSNYPGFYSTNKNLISEASIRLQDNNFYQQFSYVIESPIALNNYEARVLDALHPAGRKLFGKFQFEELIEFVSDGIGVDGFVDATIFSQAESDNSVDGSCSVYALIQPEFVSLFGLSEEQVEFLAMRAFYPQENVPTDMIYSDPYYGGFKAYDYSDKLTYIGGLSNTPANIILAGKEALCPDPVLYRYPFHKTKCKFWLSGNSKTVQEDAIFEFLGALTSVKHKVDTDFFNFGNNPFAVKLDFYPKVAENKALIALSGSGYYSGGSIPDAEIWGGASPFPDALTSRSWGIGFGADRKVYVKLYDPTDDSPVADGTHTYTHTTVLALDQYHTVAVSYDPDLQQVKINVNGSVQTFSHTLGINQSRIPLTIGSTYHVDSNGRAHTFNGLIKNVAIYNRLIDNTVEYPLLANKNYKQLKPLQKHGLIFFTEMQYPFPVDSTDYNSQISPFYKVGDTSTLTWSALSATQHSGTSRASTVKIFDQSFWHGIDKNILSTSAKEVYQSSFELKENLILCSDNLANAVYSNILATPNSDRTTMKLNYLGGGSGQFDLLPKIKLVEEGAYTLKLDIESDIQNTLGTIKGFQIIQNGVVIAYLYKLGIDYYYSNVTFGLNGNWINCICSLNLTGDISTGLTIRMLTTDDTSVYDTFVPNIIKTIDIRNFHLYKNDVLDSGYISTKHVPIISGALPSVCFESYATGYTISTTKFNITNKAIFCVCVNHGKILNGPDFELSTSEFKTNKNGTPISATLATVNNKIQLIKALHLDSDIFFSRKAVGSAEITDTDFAINTAPSSGDQTYTLFADNANFKLYELIVLDNPTDEEVDSTTNHLISKYGL